MKSDAGQTFQDRVEIVIERAGGPSEAARKAKLSRRVLDKYRSGASDPSRSRLLALAQVGEVALLWLATGEGPMKAEEGPATAPALVDPGLFGLICEGVSRVYNEADMGLSQENLGIVAARIWNELPPGKMTPERLIMVGQALERLRSELTPTTHGKQRA